jgi:hypothetical protein
MQLIHRRNAFLLRINGKLQSLDRSVMFATASSDPTIQLGIMRISTGKGVGLCKRIRPFEKLLPLLYVFNVFNNFGKSASRSK